MTVSNKEHGTTDPQHLHLVGKVSGDSEVDLCTIRRPAFFGAAPYHEPIAALDSRTSTVEFHGGTGSARGDSSRDDRFGQTAWLVHPCNIQHGKAAAQAIHGPCDETMPVLLLGSSRNTTASGWPMTMNFHKDCIYDLPRVTCREPVRDPSLKGAILLAEYTSGPGYVMRNPSEEDEGRGLGCDRPLFIGAAAVEQNIAFFPSSAILAGMDKWPAAFFARGLWDYAAAFEGTVDSCSRVRGAKELVVVRAPHPHETWPEVEQQRVHERIVAFARDVTHQRKHVEVVRGPQ